MRILQRRFARVAAAAVAVIGWGAVLVAPTGQSSAAVIPFTASLDGAQMVPPVSTTGFGSATMSLDDATSLFSWNITWSGLLGDVSVVFFHNEAAGFNGPVIIPGLGTVSPEIGSATVDAATVAELLADRIYINVHTVFSGPGEIRGQVLRGEELSQVPLPAALPLFLSALAGLGLMGWRRQRAGA